MARRQAAAIRGVRPPWLPWPAGQDGRHAGQGVSYGGVLTSTLSAELQAALAGQGAAPDPATGLVYLGGGRFYDPALGRPLQPNPVGGPPSVPQALNRYAATACGPPGVGAGAGGGGGIPPALLTTSLSAVSAGGGMAIGAYATASGVLYVQANERLLARASYRGLFTRLNRPGRGYSALYVSGRVAPGAGQRYRVLGAADEVIDLNVLKAAEKSRRWGVSYPLDDPFLALDDTVLKRLLRSGRGEFGANFALNLALAIPDLVSPWQDPYFNIGQRVTQNFVTGGGVLVGTILAIKVGAATAPLGGPVSFVVVTGTGILFIVAWNAIVPPIVSSIYNAIGAQDPYHRQRQLQPLR